MGPCLRCKDYEVKKTMFQAFTLAFNAMKTVPSLLKLIQAKSFCFQGHGANPYARQGQTL
jgi:hypothetical protein